MNKSVKTLIMALVVIGIVGIGIVGTGIGSGINGEIPAPIPPQGLSADQVQKAINISIKEQNDQVAQDKSVKDKVPTKGGLENKVAVVQQNVQQSGDGMYIIRPTIDSWYYVYNYQKCSTISCIWVNPSLNIPLKTEVWTNSFTPTSSAYTYYAVYFWEYYFREWTLLTSKYKYTDSSGVSKQGFSIPYGSYSNQFYVYSYTSYGGKWQSSSNYFGVSWY